MTDAIAVLRHDHELIERLLAALEHSDSADGDRATVGRDLAEIYARHSAAEEELVYPLIRERYPGGENVVDDRLGKRRSLEETLRALVRHDPADPQYDIALWSARLDALRDLYEEQTEILPRLAAACSDHELGDLADRLRFAIARGPIQPHPAAPHTPPFNRVTNAGLAMVDRLRLRLRSAMQRSALS